MIGIENGEILVKGKYAALGIWDTAFSVSRGPSRGVQPNRKEMTICDFGLYRLDSESLAQNQVPIDLINIFLQLGINPFDRMNAQIEEQKAKSWSAFLKIMSDGKLFFAQNTPENDEPKGCICKRPTSNE